MERVLRTKFKWEPDKIRETEALIRSVAKHVDPKLRLDVVPDDPDDNRVVECGWKLEARPSSQTTKTSCE